MTPTSKVTKFKVVLLGDAGVGKTLLMLRLTDPDFNPRQEVDPSCDIDEGILRIQSRRGNRFQIHIFDTAGEEMFRKMTSSYFRNTHAVLIVFDLARPETFQAVRDVWYRDCQNYARDGVHILIGNKSDLPRKVSEEEVLKFTESYGLPYITASSYDGPEALLDLKKQIHSHLHSSSEELDCPEEVPTRKSVKRSPFSLRKSFARLRKIEIAGLEK